ncbi:MAG: hypothetical protein RSC24_12970 [Clostridium sp.]
MIKFEGSFEVLEREIIKQIVNEMGDVNEDIAVVNDVTFKFTQVGKDIVVKKIDKIVE